MKIKTNYIVIAFFTIFIAVLGSIITKQNMEWYGALTTPQQAPGGAVIGIIWTLIFILTAASAILVWNKMPVDPHRRLFMLLFILNGFLNLFWSVLFFGRHMLGWALFEMIMLNLTNVALIYLLWDDHRMSALFLLPYFLWVCFATYLAYVIWQVNIIL